MTKRSETKKREAAQNQREGASPSPSEGGDVRGNGRRRRLTTALRKEKMCLAGYGMLCVGEIKEEDLKLKIHGLILKGLNFGGQKYALSHTDHLSLNS